MLLHSHQVSTRCLQLSLLLPKIIPATESNQMLIKPSNSLQESLLLRILLLLLAQIAANGETVNDTAVKVNLVWLLGLNEDGLGFVALLRGEDLVCFCGCDRQRAVDC